MILELQNDPQLTGTIKDLFTKTRHVGDAAYEYIAKKFNKILQRLKEHPNSSLLKWLSASKKSTESLTELVKTAAVRRIIQALTPLLFLIASPARLSRPSMYFSALPCSIFDTLSSV